MENLDDENLDLQGKQPSAILFFGGSEGCLVDVSTCRQIRELEATVKELKNALQETKDRLASFTGQASTPEPEFQQSYHSLDVIPSSPISDDSRETQTPSITNTNIPFDTDSNSHERRNSFQSNHILRPHNQASRSGTSYASSPDVVFLSGIQQWLENFGVGTASISQGFSWQNIDTGILPPYPPASYLKDPAVSDIRQLLPPRQMGEGLFEVYRTKYQK